MSKASCKADMPGFKRHGFVSVLLSMFSDAVMKAPRRPADAPAPKAVNGYAMAMADAKRERKNIRRARNHVRSQARNPVLD